MRAWRSLLGLLLLGAAVAAYEHPQAALPVVIWHGLGDSTGNQGLKELGNAITTEYHVPVFYVQIGADPNADQRAGFFGSAWEHVAAAAEQIAANPELKHGYDAIGLSQGGVFLRALAQTAPKPAMRNLITVGSPHLGVSELPPCKPTDWLCKSAVYAAKAGVYTHVAQSSIVPAQYFRDQANIAPYLVHSAFLADVNNERYGDKQVGGSEHYLDDSDGKEPQRPRNETLKANLIQLGNFVMLSFTEENIIAPYTSTAFALLNTTDPEAPVPIQLPSLPLYQEDYIGLKVLRESGRIHYGNCVGQHMQIDDECWKDVLKWVGPQEASSLAPPQLVVQA